MTTRTSAVAALALLSLTACSAPSAELVVSGTVEDSLHTVTATALAVPALNLDAGFPDLTGAVNPVTGRTAPATNPLAGQLGVGGTVRVSRVLVREGDTVHAGQPLADLDTAMQEVAVSAAKADADVAAAGVEVLAANIRDLDDKQTDLEDAKAEAEDGLRTLLDNRSKLLKARSQLGKARPTLAKNLAQARTARATLERRRQEVVATLALLEAQLPEHPELQPQVDQLRAALSQLDESLAGVRSGISKLEAALKKVDTGLRTIRAALPKIEQGLKKVRNGLRKIREGIATVEDLRGSLSDRKEVLGLQAHALRVPVGLARTQLTLAELTAPVDGVVVSVADVGEQLSPNATVVSLRETGPSTVTAWLSPAQLSQVCSGDPARITGDWMAGSGVRATLTRIGLAVDYPPTSVATEEVHLTRAVEVRFTATEQLPAGVPVDISIQPCRPAADDDPNR